jgi:cytochrome c oxidase subunit II
MPVSPASLDPAGPHAEEIAGLWWVLLAVGAAVFVLVVVLLGLAVRRGRSRDAVSTDEIRSEVRSTIVNRWIVGGGVVFPAVVLGAVLVASVSAMRDIRHTAPTGSLVIEVVGHQWWWSARYPAQGFTVANEIHIPAGQPVELRLSSVDVIHSFWVPGLHGKLDLLPDHTNTLVIEADDPGEYPGECAEFCGLQHANMGVVVIAHSAERFASWVDEQRRPATMPATAIEQRGHDVFEQQQCASCHTIRGVSTATDDGPDLTHLASRRTIAADTLANTTENLSRWLHDPSAVKAGTAMPAPRLTDDQLVALVAYLESLD